MSLRPELAAPTYIARLTAIGIALLGAGVYAIARPEVTPPAGVPAIAIAEPVHIALDVPVAVQTEAPPFAKTSARTMSLVVVAGDSQYMKLADLESEAGARMPKHGKVTHTRTKYIEEAIAPVAAADVPAAHRGWLGTQVTLDNACTTTVTGFAIVSRLTGDTGYAGDDAAGGWTAASVLKYGAPMLAAKLDGCKDGPNRTYARDATLAPASIAAPIEADPQTVKAAKRALLRSKAARAATSEWNGYYTDGSSWATAEGTTWRHEMIVHPKTGQTFIWVQASQMFGCGSPAINVFGMYRVDGETLIPLDASLGELTQIGQLVDFDNDGTFEVIGGGWLGGVMVNDLRGATLDKLDEPFYGCPC